MRFVTKLLLLLLTTYTTATYTKKNKRIKKKKDKNNTVQKEDNIPKTEEELKKDITDLHEKIEKCRKEIAEMELQEKNEKTEHEIQKAELDRQMGPQRKQSKSDTVKSISNRELREALKERGRSTKGNKKKLQQRLQRATDSEVDGIIDNFKVDELAKAGKDILRKEQLEKQNRFEQEKQKFEEQKFEEEFQLKEAMAMSFALERTKLETEENHIVVPKFNDRFENEQRDQIETTNKPLEKRSNHKVCVICLWDKPEVVITPCGHVCLCEKCSKERLKSCPICRGNIQSIVKMFFSD